MADFAYMTTAAMSPDATPSGVTRRVHLILEAAAKIRYAGTSSLPENIGAKTGLQTATSGIAMDNVTIHRDGKPVIQNLSLKIERGSITAIVGPSGAGKTTLLASLNGLLQPQAGSIAVGPNALDDPDALREHRLRSSTIFQNMR